MQKTLKRILRNLKQLWHSFTNNTELETSNRRRYTRGSIERKVRHLWDAHYVQRGVGELLQKLSTRTRKNEEFQEARRKRSERNFALKRLSEYSGYRTIIVDFFEQKEANAYLAIRHLEDKRPGISTDLYIGNQNGRLELIEEFRLMVSTALAELEMEKAKAKLKEDAIRNSQKEQ